jgi:hypothetical protein
MSDRTDEAFAIAIDLAAKCQFAVFPCADNKMPTRPKSDGGRGYLDASTEPSRIAWMWKHWPGTRIGIATGAASGIDVLDIDCGKHDAAGTWWDANYHRILPTRTYSTPSMGLHCWFEHQPGIRCSASRIAPGIDVRGDGGYVIAWGAHGLICRDPSPPGHWPQWLLDAMRPPPPPLKPPCRSPGNAIAGIARRVAQASEGERNSMVFWGACRLAEYGIAIEDAETLLCHAAAAAGLAHSGDQMEVRRTIASAYRNGRATA